MKKIIALTVALVASASAFAFQPGMTVTQINAEVAQRVAAGQPVATIIAAAKAAKISPAVVQTSLIAGGKASDAVFTAMVDAGFDVADLLPPTAAGRGNDGDGDRGSRGFNGNRRFGESRSGTIGGGGGRSVSRS